VIKSFKDDDTHKIYLRQRSRKFPPNIQQTALRKLRLLNNAQDLNDLRVPPANRLERLTGERKEQYRQYRKSHYCVSICRGENLSA
jgi:proteic killer suppression protein